MRLIAKKLVSAFALVTALLSLSLTADAAEKETASASTDSNIVTVLMQTSQGDITLELNKAKAPISVANFLAYINSGHYNGTIFHRVIRDFMVQGGGFDENMAQKATLAPIKNEANNGLKNDRGTVAMARTSVVDSATSQFFINVKDNAFLNNGYRDFGYAVFGKVTKGMDIVDGISHTATGHRDVPVEPIIIKKMTVLNNTAKD